MGGLRDYTRARSDQERDEGKSVPVVDMKDIKTKMPMAKVMSNKGPREYAVEVSGGLWRN